MASFSLIFLRHFHHPFHLAIWFQLFACLIRAAIFHLTLACVVLSFFIILPQAFMFSFFLGLFFFFFCRTHLRSGSFSACLVLVLVFRVSVYPSFLGRQRVVSDFRWFSVLSPSVQIKPETLYGASFFRIICSIGLLFPQSRRDYFFTCFKHFDIGQETRKVSVHALL